MASFVFVSTHRERIPIEFCVGLRVFTSKNHRITAIAYKLCHSEMMTFDMYDFISGFLCIDVYHQHSEIEFISIDIKSNRPISSIIRTLFCSGYPLNSLCLIFSFIRVFIFEKTHPFLLFISFMLTFSKFCRMDHVFNW